MCRTRKTLQIFWKTSLEGQGPVTYEGIDVITTEPECKRFEVLPKLGVSLPLVPLGPKISGHLVYLEGEVKEEWTGWGREENSWDGRV